MTADPANGRFRILTVCSGNICRSPFVEQYLRHGLSGLPGVVVGSAGTIALEGDTMPPEAEALCRRYGVDPHAHRARALKAGHVEHADLVLGMAREHRSAAVSLHPRASRSTFTLRQFARLANGIGDDELADAAALSANDITGRLQAAVAAVAARRGIVPAPDDPLDDDVIDPHKHDDATFRLSGEQAIPAADTVLDLFRRAATIGPRP